MPIFTIVTRSRQSFPGMETPSMNYRRSLSLVFALALLAAARPSQAQEIPTEPGAAAGAVPPGPRLGPTPGAGGGAIGNQPGTADATFGGRPGPSVPRVPSAI